MAKYKTKIWTWKVTPLNKRDTKEKWVGERQDLKRYEEWICQEKSKRVWECKLIKEK